jgi:ribonuclease P protein component
VLIVEKAQEASSFKVAFLASKSLGIAVSRNRAKRILRAANEQYLGKILPGNNILVIARAGLLTSSFTGIQAALHQVFSKAKILKEND